MPSFFDRKLFAEPLKVLPASQSAGEHDIRVSEDVQMCLISFISGDNKENGEPENYSLT